MRRALCTARRWPDVVLAMNDDGVLRFRRSYLDKGESSGIGRVFDVKRTAEIPCDQAHVLYGF
jgi:hypothetical protein